MIYHLKRNQLNVAKYDACIELAQNSRIYAFSWYLDIVADNWDVLVLNDYEAVMPLPWRKKYFIKYVYPPAWTQQLGVFSNLKIEADLVEQFINSIPWKFKKITIQFNSENDLSFIKSEKRVNYILPLNKPYEEIYKGFNNNRKRILKKKVENYITTNDFCVDEFVLIAKKYYSFLNYSNEDYITLKKLLVYLLKKDQVIKYGISNAKEGLIGGVVFIKSKCRITYLCSIMTPFAKKQNSSTEIINLLIKEFSNSNQIIDFEGSMNMGISSFFKSFGAILEVYSQYVKRRLL